MIKSKTGKIWKGKSKIEAVNYRPIFLINLLSKIVEEDQPPEGSSTNPTPTLNENDIDDDCVEKFAKKTNRQLRINELIREHSHKVSYDYNHYFHTNLWFLYLR